MIIAISFLSRMVQGECIRDISQYSIIQYISWILLNHIKEPKAYIVFSQRDTVKVYGYTVAPTTSHDVTITDLRIFIL